MGALTHNGEVLQSLPANASQINFDKTGTNLNSTQTENAIKEVNAKVNTNTSDIDQLKSGLTSATTVENITSTFYTHLESGVTLYNDSFVTKCGKHIVGDIVLVLDNNISGNITSLITLAYAPIHNINSYCVGATDAYTASGIMYMWISASNSIVQVQNTYSLNNIKAIKIHLDYFSNT